MSVSGDPHRVYFVGRKPELEKLNQSLEAVRRDQRAVFVQVIGEPGTGKTTLVNQFLQPFVQDSKVNIGLAACAPEVIRDSESRTSYGPFNQILAALTSKVYDPKIDREKVVDFLRTVIPAWVGAIDPYAGPALSTLIEGAMLAVPVQNFFNEDNKHLQFEKGLRRLVGRKQTIIVLEDVHWVDDSSMGLIAYLNRCACDIPVLFVLTFRDLELEARCKRSRDFDEVYSNLTFDETIHLSQGIQIKDYLLKRYGEHTLSNQDIHLVQERTENGYPLFVSTLFDWLEEKHYLIAEKRSERTIWRLSPGVELEPIIPDRLKKLLDWRLRNMEEQLKEILTLASVEGQRFTAQTLERLVQLEERQLNSNLEKLEDDYRMVHNEGRSSMAYQVIDFYHFTHEFIRAHIYSKLKDRDRRTLHQRVGEVLEILYQDNLEAIAPQLARHFEIAFQPVKSARYCREAARHEVDTYSLEEVQGWCERGLKQLAGLPDSPEISELRFDLYLISADGYYYQGQLKKAENTYLLAEKQAGMHPMDPTRLVRLYGDLANVLDDRGKYAEGLLAVEKGKAVASQHIPSDVYTGEKLELLSLEGLLYTRTHQYQRAVDLLQQTVDRVEALPAAEKPVYDIAGVYNCLGISYGEVGEFEKAIACYRKGLEYTAAVHDISLESTILTNLTVDCKNTGRLAEAEEAILRGLELSQQIGDRSGESFSQGVLGSVYLARRQYSEAITVLYRSIEIGVAIEDTWYQATAESDLALAYLALGRQDEAREHARRSLEKAMDDFDRVIACIACGTVDSNTGNWEAATDVFEDALKIARKVNNTGMRARVLLAYGEAHLRNGDRQKAEQLLQEALADFQAVKLQNKVQEIEEMLAGSGVN